MSSPDSANHDSKNHDSTNQQSAGAANGAVRNDTARLRRWVTVSGVVLIAMIIAADGYEAWQDYRTTIRESERIQVGLSRVLSEQTARMVQEVDVVLSDYAAWAVSAEGRRANTQSLHEQLRSEVMRLPFVYSAVFAGTNGQVLATTQSDAVSNLSLARRDAFTVPARAQDSALYIGQPFIGPRDKVRTFALSRRANSSSGEFAGVVVARVAFEYLSGFYAGVNATPDTSIRLVRQDGIVLAQYPPATTPIVDDPYVREKYVGVAQLKEHVRYSIADGQEQLAALRGVEGYPIVVEVTRPLSSVLQSWVHNEIGSTIRTLVLVALAGLLLMALRAALLRHDRMENERRRLEQELETTQRVEALGILAASVAHDFNNVLTAIVGYGELAHTAIANRSSAGAASALDNMDRLLAAAERARLLVRRVLTFNPRRSLNYVAVPIEPIVREVVQQIEATLPPTVTVTVQGLELPASVLGDATEIHQVVMNLCANAVQAMPNGGRLEIRVATMEIEVARELTLGQLLPGSWVCLSFVDNGVGLQADQIKSMFEPFYTTRQPGQGTGIGLTVVRNIVSRMHGALDVQSHIGSAENGLDPLGSVTRISAYWPAIAPETEPSVSQKELPRTGHGETVMVVDDKPELVMLAEEVLASLGYEPVGFIGARAALGAFRRNPRRFDAILTDERMQSLRGCDLAKMIREIDPTVPVILLTGYRDADIDVRAKEAGIVAILDKPLHVQTLSAALRHQFKQRLAAAEA